MEDRFRFRAWHPEVKKVAQSFTLQEAIGSRNIEGVDTRRIIYMQCTGLKDKSSKLIYESDLVQYAKHDSSQGTFKTWVESNAKIGKVFFDKGGFHVDFGLANLEPFLGAINEKLEVIGNIYDNPELLK